MPVCIIPARGGSKRIPGKNLRPFLGRPMIGWPIAAALASGLFERIVVSTDDPAIAEVARAEGAEVPFLRPAALADDLTPTVPVIAHAIGELGLGPEVPVCCLYATAPFVRPADLAAGLDGLRRSGAPFCLSVTSYAFPIQRALRRGDDSRLEMFDPAQALTRSQDLEEAWHDAGQFYWALAATWATAPSVFAGRPAAVPVPRHLVQDIDTPEDWAEAELKMRALSLQEEEGR